MRRVLFLTALLLVLGPSPQGTAPGPTGRIVFLRLELQDNPAM